jgi:2-C-methyl-D-erythritol 2,4-cyclodiphosphate synthase
MHRVGQGFDIHRLEPGRPFVLGGVPLEWPKGPVGHSDGDALFHALTDALLGAAGLGDIGEWFPPGDERFKGADSSELLAHVMTKIREDGWTLDNVDCTIILEAPKLAPYKVPIRQQVAQLTGLSTEQVNIKAKTAEKLGPIGHEEAVASLVTVLLHK